MPDISPYEIDKHLYDKYKSASIEWFKRLTSLSAGALTLLVSLQSSYVPENPKGLFLLQLSWGSLAISVLSGLAFLFSESQTALEALQKFRNQYGLVNMDKKGRATIIYPFEKVPQMPYHMPRLVFEFYKKIAVFSFACSVCSITWFAILNTG